MPIDATVSGSPGWWFLKLLNKLAADRPRYDLLDSYMRNENGIPFGADKAVRVAYQRLMTMSRTNYADLVVEATRQRMQPVGFRTGAEGDALGDAEAWRIWQANSLDADHALVTRTQLSLSTAYVIVGGVDPDIGAPLITPEDPREVVAIMDPQHRRRVRAALKVFTDDDAGQERAYLYLRTASGATVQQATRPQVAVGGTALNISGWEWDGKTSPLPAMPVVPFFNRAPTLGPPMGEFEQHLSILDRINYTILNRLEIMTLQAFKQRAVKGVPNADAQGNDIDYDDIFAADPGALWVLPATAEMWESGAVDLTPVRESIKDDVRDLSAVTSTPMYLFTPDAASGSAEGASLLREALTFKVRDRITQASESLEQVMSLAFLFSGDTERAQRGDMECLWAPPERFSLAERYDAASKAQAAGVPWRTVMTDILGFSPQAVDRMEGERASDQFMSALNTPATDQRPERMMTGVPPAP